MTNTIDTIETAAIIAAAIFLGLALYTVTTANAVFAAAVAAL